MEESNEILGHVLMELANKFKFNFTKKNGTYILSNENYNFVLFIHEGAIVVELESKNLRINSNKVIGVYYSLSKLKKDLEDNINNKLNV